MQLVRGGIVLLVATLAIALQATPALARSCDEVGSDAYGIGTTRATILVGCRCDGSRKRYERCAARKIDAAIAAGSVARACRPRLMGIARHSRCGRPDAVTCCRTAADGSTKAFIAGSAAACRPNAPGGRACVAGSPTTFGACAAWLDPASSGSACLTSPPCGDGKVDPGEECDGEWFCHACRIAYRLCCLTPAPPGARDERVCRDFTYDSLGATEQFGHHCRFGAWYAGAGSCSSDRQSCLPPIGVGGSLCCQGVGRCADDAATGCAMQTYPYGPWSWTIVGRCAADGVCRPRGRVR